MKVVAIIQARMGSSRLPGKSLRALRGRPLIQHVVERTQAIPGIDQVVLATSGALRDAPLGDFVSGMLNVPVFYGDEADVLRRFTTVAECYNADIIVRVTGDCPFLDPFIARDVLCAYLDGPLEVQYMSNDTLTSGYPDGTDVEVFTRRVLKYADLHAVDVLDREHVTPFMRRNVTTGTLKSDTDWSRIKLSVDTLDDYVFAGKVAMYLPPGEFALEDTLRAVAKAE